MLVSLKRRVDSLGMKFEESTSQKEESLVVQNSLEETVQWLKNREIKNSAPEEVFVIGGASLYAQFLPLASRLYISQVCYDGAADTFFPKWSEQHWNLIESASFDGDSTKGQLPWKFGIFEREITAL